MLAVLKRPSAWIPIALSIGILAMEAGFFFFGGAPQPQADEGVGAHLFQLWLTFEAVSIPIFAFRTLPQAPKEASLILALQLILVFLGCFPIFYFHL